MAKKNKPKKGTRPSSGAEKPPRPLNTHEKVTELPIELKKLAAELKDIDRKKKGWAKKAEKLIKKAENALLLIADGELKMNALNDIGNFENKSLADAGIKRAKDEWKKVSDLAKTELENPEKTRSEALGKKAEKALTKIGTLVTQINRIEASLPETWGMKKIHSDSLTLLKEAAKAIDKIGELKSQVPGLDEVHKNLEKALKKAKADLGTTYEAKKEEIHTTEPSEFDPEFTKKKLEHRALLLKEELKTIKGKKEKRRKIFLETEIRNIERVAQNLDKIRDLKVEIVKERVPNKKHKLRKEITTIENWAKHYLKDKLPSLKFLKSEEASPEKEKDTGITRKKLTAAEATKIRATGIEGEVGSEQRVQGVINLSLAKLKKIEESFKTIPPHKISNKNIEKTIAGGVHTTALELARVKALLKKRERRLKTDKKKKILPPEDFLKKQNVVIDGEKIESIAQLRKKITDLENKTENKKEEKKELGRSRLLLRPLMFFWRPFKRLKLRKEIKKLQSAKKVAEEAQLAHWSNSARNNTQRGRKSGLDDLKNLQDHLEAQKDLEESTVTLFKAIFAQTKTLEKRLKKHEIILDQRILKSLMSGGADSENFIQILLSINHSLKANELDEMSKACLSASNKIKALKQTYDNKEFPELETAPTTPEPTVEPAGESRELSDEERIEKFNTAKRALYGLASKFKDKCADDTDYTITKTIPFTLNQKILRITTSPLGINYDEAKRILNAYRAAAWHMLGSMASKEKNEDTDKMVYTTNYKEQLDTMLEEMKNMALSLGLSDDANKHNKSFDSWDTLDDDDNESFDNAKKEFLDLFNEHDNLDDKIRKFESLTTDSKSWNPHEENKSLKKLQILKLAYSMIHDPRNEFEPNKQELINLAKEMFLLDALSVFDVIKDLIPDDDVGGGPPTTPPTTPPPPAPPSTTPPATPAAPTPAPTAAPSAPPSPATTAPSRDVIRAENALHSIKGAHLKEWLDNKNTFIKLAASRIKTITNDAKKIQLKHLIESMEGLFDEFHKKLKKAKNEEDVNTLQKQWKANLENHIEQRTIKVKNAKPASVEPASPRQPIEKLMTRKTLSTILNEQIGKEPTKNVKKKLSTLIRKNTYTTKDIAKILKEENIVLARTRAEGIAKALEKMHKSYNDDDNPDDDFLEALELEPIDTEPRIMAA